MINSNDIGFVCPILNCSGTGKSFHAVGLVRGKTMLVGYDGEMLEVGEDELNANYEVEPRLAVNPKQAGELLDVAVYSPVMKKFSGESVALIAMGWNEYESEKYAIYRSLDNGSYWAEKVDFFYDRFAPTSTFVFGDHPRIVDPDGNLGFLVNEGSDDIKKHPPLTAYYDENEGVFTLSL